MITTEPQVRIDRLLELAGIRLLGHNRKNVKKTIITIDGGKSVAEIISEVSPHAETLEDVKYIRSTEFKEDLLTRAKEAEKSSAPEVPNIESDGEDILEGYVLYKDVSFTFDKDPKFFVGNSSGEMSLIPAHAFIASRQIESPESVAIPAVIEYAPRSPLGIYGRQIASGETLPHMNSFIPAPWRRIENTPDCLPEDFELLVNHIFPKQVDRDYFFNWVYKSLTSRAETYLILQGAGAIGKNRLKIFLRALHGHRNSSDGKKSTLTGTFNSQLGENTLLYFDELRYSEAEENVMKEIPNGTVPIEGKFRDTTKGTRIYCSMVIANNKERDNFIAFDARKFVPLELTSRPLTDVMSLEDITAMSKKVEFDDDESFDVNYVAQIGNWILKHGKDPRWPNCEYRGPRFWALAHTSMPFWQKRILEVLFEPHPKFVGILSEQPFRYSRFLSAYEKEISKRKVTEAIRADYSNVEHFFDIFRDLEGNKIFHLERVEGSIMGDFTIKIIQNPILFSNGKTMKVEERLEDLL